MQIGAMQRMQTCGLYQQSIARPFTTSRTQPTPKSRSLIARAEEESIPIVKPKLPSGATEPPVSPELPPPWFGFVDRAERLNSRAAMIGFFALIALEAILGKGLLDVLGFNTGNGLPFEI